MKRILFCAAAFLLAACDRGGNFDATGTFEATEVTVSAEAAGRILRFDAEEGDLLTAGEQVGEIDTVQLYLRRLQLERQRASVRSERPDIAKQAAALREQIAKQRTERRRVENLLRDGAATAKQLDDMDAQLKVLNGQLEALLSTLANSAASIDENASAIDLQIAQVEDQLRKCRIVSPVAGTVLARYAEAGRIAEAAGKGPTAGKRWGLRLGKPLCIGSGCFRAAAEEGEEGRICAVPAGEEPAVGPERGRCVIRRDLAAEYLFRARPSGSGFYRQEGRQAEPWKRTGRQRFEQREPAKNRTAVEVSRSPIPTIGEASPPKT